MPNSETIYISEDSLQHQIDITIGADDIGITTDTTSSERIFPVELGSDSMTVSMSVESDSFSIPFSVIDSGGGYSGDIPSYEGPYAVIPGASEQRLQTSGCYLARDIVVYAAPIDIPAYMGSYSITPNENEQTLQTNGYYMDGNVVVHAVIAMTDSQIRYAVNQGWR